ncbi:MAG: HNH endonuclease signature motif containing protein [Nanoarchaeota archaeon]
MARFQAIGKMPDRFDLDGRKVCRNCENLVPDGRRHYCSDSCGYSFFVDHHWPTVRKEVLRRDGRRCSICEKRYPYSQLDVDHIISLNMGGEAFDKKNLRTLCKECHKAKTRLDRSVEKEIGDQNP